MSEISTPYGKVTSFYNSSEPSKEPLESNYKSENYTAKNYAYQRDLKKWIAHILGETPENYNKNFNRNFDPKFKKAYKKAYGKNYEPYGIAIKTDLAYNQPMASKGNTRNNKTTKNNEEVYNQPLASMRQNTRNNKKANKPLASKGGKSRRFRKGRKGTRRA